MKKGKARVPLKPASFLHGKSVIICGTIRNAGGKLAQRVQAIKSAFSSAVRIYWFIVESDSADDTVTELERLKAGEGNFEYISLGILKDKMPRRAERLAWCRNIYVKYLKDNSIHYDFTVVADLDGVNDGLTRQSIESCNEQSDWDVCTANQSAPYYDVWALRHQAWSPNDCFRHYDFLKEHGVSEDKALMAAVYTRMVRIGTDEGWLRVDSAFGGLAIYRTQLFRHARYCGIAPDGREECEHVYLHKMMKNRGAQIFINPRLINGGYNEHSSKLKVNSPFKALRNDLRRVFVSSIRRSMDR